MTPSRRPIAEAMRTDPAWDGHEWAGLDGECQLCACPPPTAAADDEHWATALTPCLGREPRSWDQVDEDVLHECLDAVALDLRRARRLVDAHMAADLRRVVVALSKHALELLVALDRIRPVP